MHSSPNAFVQRAYDRLARVYDPVFGAILQPGRVRAVGTIPPGPDLRVLELGIGTGLTVPLYRPDWRVSGVDLSMPMLGRARARVRRCPDKIHVRLLQADGAALPFAAHTFDVVLMPYAISVVPDPLRVAREMRRVCRPDGRVILLNHFLSEHATAARVERWLSPLTERVGFRTDLPLGPLLANAGLRPVSIERVNVPPLWTLVTCVRSG